MVASELDGPFGPQSGRVDHPGAVGVIPDQVAGHVKRGPDPLPGFEPSASVGQQGVQPVPFGVGLLSQPAQVNRQGLGAAHQGGEPGTAERRIGVALRRRAFDVRDQARVRGPRSGQGGLAGTAGTAGPRGEPGRQSAYAAEQRLRDRRAHLVE